MLFVSGFVATCMVGGLTGVIRASVSIDTQVHDSMFVVAHLHYELCGGAVFPLFGAFYYWFPKWTGRMLGERLGLWNFLFLFVGFHLTFWPMHHLGLHGMARRRYTYGTEEGLGFLNHLASSGAALMAVGVLLFIWNVWRSRHRGRVAGPNPWGAGTLEWATSSPPPPYNFQHLPTAHGHEPVWENRPDAPVVTGLRSDTREALVTTTLDAVPDHRYHLAPESIVPFLLAVATATILIGGGIVHPNYALGGLAGAMLVLFGWFWANGIVGIKSTASEAKPA
jgi:cytochrome c oxidase subunit 1